MMIISLVIIAAALYWLMVETKWLTIIFLVGLDEVKPTGLSNPLIAVALGLITYEVVQELINEE